MINQTCWRRSSNQVKGDAEFKSTKSEITKWTSVFKSFVKSLCSSLCFGLSFSLAATFAANLRVGREHPHVDLIKVVLGRRNQQQKMAPQKAEGCNAGQRQQELKHMCGNWQSKRPKQIAKDGAAAMAHFWMGTGAAQGKVRGAEQKGTGFFGVGKWQFIKSFEVSKISNCSQSANWLPVSYTDTHTHNRSMLANFECICVCVSSENQCVPAMFYWV